MRLRKFKSGDERAFAELYERYQRPIHGYVRAKVSCDELARDLTQEIFLKVHRFRASYREEYAFTTWLWTIARNTLSDHFRAQGSTVEISLDEPESPISAGELPCPRRNAESRLVKHAERRGILRKLKHLTRLQRRVLWMQLVHQHSHAEIAGRLGMSLAAVKNVAFRARATLAERWNGPAASA